MSEVDPIAKEWLDGRYHSGRDILSAHRKDFSELAVLVRADQDKKSRADERKRCMACVCDACTGGVDAVRQKRLDGIWAWFHGKDACFASHIREREFQESSE